MDIYKYTMRVLVNGRKVKEHTHDGRVFIEAKEGSEYELEIKNHGDQKALAIVSVDGVSVISGKAAKSKSGGYILEPRSTVKLKGFQNNNNSVGAFSFTGKSNSYASSQGEGGNEGVISVRVFEEKVEIPVWGEPIDWQDRHFEANVGIGANVTGANVTGGWIGATTDCYSGSASGGYGGTPCSARQTRSKATYENKGLVASAAQPANFDMGTTWGQKKGQKVTEVDFKKGDLFGEMNIFYASRQALIDMGVPVFCAKETSVAFPKGFSDFATPPAGWIG